MRGFQPLLVLALGLQIGELPAVIAFPDSVVGERGISSAAYGKDDNEIVFMIWPNAPELPAIMVSRRSSTGWSRPVAALTGFSGVNIGPAVGTDGKLYFESNHRDPQIPGRRDTDIWVAMRDGNTWKDARPLGFPFNSEFQEHNVSVSAGGALCFNSTRPGGFGEHDIYCSSRDGEMWREPVNLGSAVNSASTDGAAHIDTEERFIVFGSDRPGGAGGDDLYISTRRDGVWQPAVNLGPTINTAAGEWAPALSRDGKRLLFTRAVGEGSSARFTVHEVAFDPGRYR